MKTVHSVQALRGIAAGAVVLAHAYEHGNGRGSAIAGFGAILGVNVFFVISGFVIGLTVQGGRFDPWNFAVKRLSRVAPLYWLLTVALSAILLVAPSVFNTTAFSIAHLVKSLFFLPQVSTQGHVIEPILKPGWTLNFEIFFYALVLSTFWASSAKLRAIIITFVIVTLAFIGETVLPLPGVLQFYTRPETLLFCAGLWLAAWWRIRGTRTVPTAARLGLTAAALLAAFRVISFGVYPPSALSGDATVILAPIIIVVAALSNEMHFKHLFFEWVGRVSYSLYLAHMFVVGAAWAVYHKLGITADTTLGFAGIVAIFAVALLLAHLLYEFVERPTNLRLRAALVRRPVTSVNSSQP